jgi:hypothetical protein
MSGYPDGCTQNDHDRAYGSWKRRKVAAVDPWVEARRRAAEELRNGLANTRKCRFCGDSREPLNRFGHCQVCVDGMARTNGD